MRIDASSLVADVFRYESAQEDGTRNEIVLGRSGGVTGFYEYGPGHAVDARAVRFEVTRALWHVGASRFGLLQPSRLDGVRFALSAPPGDAPTTLALDVTAAALASVEYAAGELLVAGDATLAGLEIERAADGRLSVAASTLVARNVRVTRASTKLAVAEVHLEKLSIVSEGASIRMGAQRLELVGVALASGVGPVELARLVARDLSFQGEHLEVAELSLSDLTVAHAFAPPQPKEASAGPRPGPRALPDIPALDHLEGHVSVDVKVTAAVPVFKDREVHHPLRIPIDAGAIDFGKLEHSLSTLEDALLDFEVEDDELILELDVVPIVHFDNVTLVSWSLAEPADRELAKLHRVRLRRLLQYRLPTREPRKPRVHAKKKSIRLVRLDLAPIDVSLSLTAPVDLALAGGVVRLGSAAQPSVESLTVSGALHSVLEGDACPGHLELAASGIHAMLEDLSVGPARILRARVDVAAIERVRMELGDLSPRGVAGTVRAAHVRDLSLDLVTPPPGGASS